VIDAQSLRAAATVPASSRGYDGAKKVPGRKRHIVVDCLGLLLAVLVTAAPGGEREPAQPRSASRFIFERTPSTLAGTGASPSAAPIS
jgi:hypothetical protein